VPVKLWRHLVSAHELVGPQATRSSLGRASGRLSSAARARSSQAFFRAGWTLFAATPNAAAKPAGGARCPRDLPRLRSVPPSLHPCIVNLRVNPPSVQPRLNARLCTSPADADVALHAADDASGSCSPQVSSSRCGLARAAWPRSQRLLRACRMGRHRQIRRQRQLQKPFAEPLGVALLYALPLLAGGAALVGAAPPGAAARPPRRRRCCRAAPPFGVALLDGTSSRRRRRRAGALVVGYPQVNPPRCLFSLRARMPLGPDKTQGHHGTAVSQPATLLVTLSLTPRNTHNNRKQPHKQLHRHSTVV
jgi:hypothetical protein